MKRCTKRFAGLVLTLLGCLIGATVTGCAHRVWNRELDHLEPTARYEFSNRLPKNEEELFIVLAFSGGGTRDPGAFQCDAHHVPPQRGSG